MKAERQGGSTLIITVIVLTVISLLAAATLTRVNPRLRAAYQNAAWQEARLAAEAGVDAAMGDLLRHAANPAVTTWPGWSQPGTGSIADLRTADGGKGPHPTGSVGTLIAGGKNAGTDVRSLNASVLALAFGNSGKGSKGRGEDEDDEEKGSSSTAAALVPIVTSAPVYLNNLSISAVSGIPTAVDVQLWALQPLSHPSTTWLRIRSMATCALPPTAYESPESLDAPLRRFSLRTLRPRLRQNTLGNAVAVPFPNVSRTVEVLVEPILPFELALWTQTPPLLGRTGAWGIDSYDSGDVKKSGAGGVYPGRDSGLAQKNGHLACSQARTAPQLYGPLLDAGGARVFGSVATNGGDDPATPAHENVIGAVNLDPARTTDDFCREMNPVPRPEGTVVLPPPALGPFLPGPAATPAIYHIAGDLGDFRLARTADGAPGTVVLLVDGSVTLTAALIVPPSVTAILFVRGDLSFANDVNNGPWSSRRAGQLMIFAESAAIGHRTLQVHGPSTVYASFYGPTSQVLLDGSVDWCGAIGAYGFTATSGGDGGIHYDEALAPLGPAISWRIARYIEDVRE